MHDTIGGEQADGFEFVSDACGVTPSIWSVDFGFSTHPNDSFREREAMLDEAIRRARGGALITLSWHQCNPVADEPCTFAEGVQKPLSDEEWQALLTDGTSLNRKWKQQLDRLADVLERLAKEDVTVLLRPLHEANIPGFWWADQDATRPIALWHSLQSYLVDHKGLSNLVWVWSVSYHPRYWSDVSQYYPGAGSVDVIGVDIYPPTQDGKPEFAAAWQALASLAGDQPIALTEVSRLPDQYELARRAWAYVIPWGKNLLLRDNEIERVCELYSSVAPVRWGQPR